MSAELQIDTSTVDSIEREIHQVAKDIKKVEKKIDDVETKLEQPGISDSKEATLVREKFLLMEEKACLQQEKASLRQEKVLLMQHQPQTAITSIPENAEVKFNKADMLSTIQQALKKKDRATPQKTPWQLGADEIARLKSENIFYDVPATSEGEAVLTEEQAKVLTGLTTEHCVVAYMTPFLEKALGCDNTMILVNSEEYKWLETSGNDSKYSQKPDMFLCHTSICKRRKPFKVNNEDGGILSKIRRSDDIFGVLTRWEL